MEAKQITYVLPPDPLTAKQRIKWQMFKAKLEEASYKSIKENGKEIKDSKPIWRQG